MTTKNGKLMRINSIVFRFLHSEMWDKLEIVSQNSCYHNKLLKKKALKTTERNEHDRSSLQGRIFHRLCRFFPTDGQAQQMSSRMRRASNRVAYYRLHRRTTAETVAEFMDEKIKMPFRTPALLVRDNATWFTAGVVHSFPNTLCTRCETVWAYAPSPTDGRNRWLGR